jgi:hypothetical protein
VPDQAAVDAERVADIRKVLLEGGGAAAETVARPDPQGWGTLTGTFTVPKAAAAKLANRPDLPVSGPDAAFCNSHGQLKSQAVRVDAQTGAFQDVVIFLAEDLSKVEKPELWLNPSAAPGNKEPAVFDQKYCMFLSHVFPLQVSQPMEIHNSDEKSHNTKLEPGKNPPFNETIAPGSVLTYQHTKEERVPYKAGCSIHPWMDAYIFPRDNGYVDVSDDKGKFTIENLPAGVPLLFKVWQEKAGFVKNVTIDGQKQALPSKGLPLTIPVGGELQLDVEIDPQAL